MQVNPEDSPPDIYVTWSNPRMTDFENGQMVTALASKPGVKSRCRQEEVFIL